MPETTPTQRPLVIAHRGASGYLPEHTLEAYAMAYGLGADYVEPDLALSKDGVFICMHDIHLDDTTNVAEVFPERHRGDGHWYPADFTLDEIRQLNAHERLPHRYPQHKGHFQIPTFAEMIELVQGLNQSTGRDVGIYPELKHPAWHRDNGLPMEEIFLDLVHQYGYRGPDAKIFVQSFELDSLQRMRDLGSELPQIFLFEDDRDAAHRISDAGLEEIAAVAQGIGPHKNVIHDHPDLVARAHQHHLLLHPWVLRADQLGPGFQSFGDEVRYYADLGVDGFFTDFTDRALAALADH